jgi:hypothetical protein
LESLTPARHGDFGNAKEALMMIAILFIGLLIALAAYLILARTRKDGSTKAKRQEKSEIIRQLLALSDQEDHISATPPPPGKLQGSRREFVSSSKKS